MSHLLSQIESPADLQRLTDAQLAQVTKEIRDELVRVLGVRPAHFASNLGVVELSIALHLTFDFCAIGSFGTPAIKSTRTS